MRWPGLVLVALVGCTGDKGGDSASTGTPVGAATSTGTGAGAAAGTGTGTGAATGMGTGTGGAVTCQSMAIPSYIYPGAEWATATAEAGRVSLLIANPSSGPGTAIDPNYQSVIAAAQAAGITVLGYVPTTYGARAAQDVYDDIDDYQGWYGIDGIFFDETPTTTAEVPYYVDIVTYAEAQISGATTVLNPGTLPDEAYQGVADVIMVYESYASNYAAANLPDWTAGYPAEGFWHVLHSASGPTEIDLAVALSRTRNAGLFYATEDVLPNPYDTLPTHFVGQLDLLRSGCPTVP